MLQYDVFCYDNLLTNAFLPTRYKSRGTFLASGLPTDSLLQFGRPLLEADFDSNGAVDGDDFLAWQGGFGTQSGARKSDGDFDNDEDVDGDDFLGWQAEFGQSASPSDLDDLAVLESADATFERNIGNGAGEVSWAGGSGGFASRGGAGGLAVTLEGGAELSFSSTTVGFSGNALQLGSPFADGKVELTNNLDLEGAEGIVQIAENPDSDQDFAEISGDITSSIAGGELTVNEDNGGSFRRGLLVLSGNNSMSILRIEDASVDAVQGVGLPDDANLEFDAGDDNRPAVWVGSGTFERNIGSGPGEVMWIDPGGFGARGGELTVTLEGGAVLDWESAEAGFNSEDFQLGSNHSDSRTVFTNSVVGWDDGAGGSDTGNRDIVTFGNPSSESDEIRIDGDFVEGFNGLDVDGFNSRVVFQGNITTGADLRARESITLLLTGTVVVGDDVDVQDTANMFVNSTMTVNDDFDTDDTAGFGGIGTITLQNDGTMRVDNGAFLRPGPDLNEVGTLNVVFQLFEGEMILDDTATYEMEFANGGGLEHDSVNIVADDVSALRLGDGDDHQWNLELSALDDLSGLVGSTDEFDLFVWNDFIDLVVNGENITTTIGIGTGVLTNVAALISSDFDVSLATVNYVIESSLAGRVYVTGLTLNAGGGAAAAVPEPASLALAALAALAFFGRRRFRG